MCGVFYHSGPAVSAGDQSDVRGFSVHCKRFSLIHRRFWCRGGLRTQEYKDAGTKLLANGIVYVILGLVILYHRNESEHIIGALWGILGVLKGSEALHISFIVPPDVPEKTVPEGTDSGHR